MQSEEVVYGVGPGEPNLVSVIIPTYNRANLLDQAIESALAQTHTAVEVLVVDDGSTDNTREVTRRYDSRVRYIYQKNAGVAAARNTGMMNARGEFIALLDSDDIWLPWKLAAQVAFLRRFPQLGFVWTDMSAVDEGGTPVASRYLRTYYDAYRFVTTEQIMSTSGVIADEFPEVPAELSQERYFMGDIFRFMMLGNLVHTSTVVMRRERMRLTGSFDTSLPITGEDYDFHLRSSAIGAAGFLNVPSILYRIGAADRLSAEANQLVIARNDLRTVRAAFQRYGDRVELPKQLVNRRFATTHRWIAIEALRLGYRDEARQNFWASLKYQPLQPKTAAQLLVSLLPNDLTRIVFSAYHGLKRLRPVRTTS